MPGTGRCCASGICSSWAGAHLVSQGCILYGVFELEAAFDMSRTNAANLSPGAFYFTALYMVKSAAGNFDPSWNEIDIGMIVGPRGLEYHCTVRRHSSLPTHALLTTLDSARSSPPPPPPPRSPLWTL